jgi:hypothetical protein
MTVKGRQLSWAAFSESVSAANLVLQESEPFFRGGISSFVYGREVCYHRAHPRMRHLTVLLSRATRLRTVELPTL